jgi:hypothetical protein
MSAPTMGATTPRAKPVISKRNLFREVYFSLQQNHKRVIATVASASIGIFGLVAGIGITRTRDAQTLNRFDALAATQLTARVQQSDPSKYLVTLPSNAPERLENINGIIAAGTYAEVFVGLSESSGSAGAMGPDQQLPASAARLRSTLDTPAASSGARLDPRLAASKLAAASLPSVDRSTANSPTLYGGAPSALTEFVRATPRQSDAGEQRFPAVLRAVSPGLFPTIQAAFTTGRPFGEGNNTNRDHVAVIGLAVANQLGITSLANRPSVFIGNEPFEVLGIVGDNTVKPELINAVLLPTLTAEKLYETTGTSIEIRTSVNATNLTPGVLSEQIQLALANTQPGAIGVTKPSGLTNAVRDKISGDLNSGFTFLAVLLIALTIATISISTSSAVEARRYEIGLRRALGASRKHIRQQIIIEASLTGVVAAIVGTLTGLLAVLYWSHRNQWHVVQDRITIPAALLAGPLLGILGGIWPAWKASRQEPADTLRSS